ncbi:MAG: hypothetical protein SFU86_17650 [Pirellulaceae bacterium]|nr:hypothetical protein [Pirellulaceae bacterium]
MSDARPVIEAEQRPAGNQFSLRGLFILMTAISAILALLSLVLREPLHWLGMLGIIAFCLAMVGVLEAGRKLFPPRPYVPTPAWGYPVAVPIPPGEPVSPFQGIDFRERRFADGECPFRLADAHSDRQTPPTAEPLLPPSPRN